MSIQPKIKIVDNRPLRSQIEQLYRQASLHIHRLARHTHDPAQKTALRVVGQAIATGHMKEHAMVTADYAIKLIGLLSNHDINYITKERLWQFNKLKSLSNKIS